MERDYQATFLASDVTERVLMHIIGKELCFFQEITNEEERVLHNAAKRILRNIGAWEINNAEKITRSITSIIKGEKDARRNQNAKTLS